MRIVIGDVIIVAVTEYCYEAGHSAQTGYGTIGMMFMLTAHM